MDEGFDCLKIKQETHPIVWQFWEPVENNSNNTISESIVNKCIDSIEKNRYLEYKHLVLSFKDLSLFVRLPDFVYKKIERKENGFSLAAFSDILRFSLLLRYGGIWADATMFALNSFPREYLEMSKEYGFTFYRSGQETVENRIKWRSIDPGYFSWNRFSRVNWLNSFVIAGAKRDLIKEILRILLLVWKYEDKYPHYFTTQIIEDFLIKKMSYHSFEFKSDVPPHYLQFKLKDKFEEKFLMSLCQNSPLQKLTWKYTGDVVPDSYLDWILKRR